LPAPSPATAVAGRGVWIALPTYNELENLEPLLAAVLNQLPEARVLVIDDGSPDGTGELADRLSSADPRIEVMHRASKNGLGEAYRAGLGWILAQPDCDAIVQMDCDFSHAPDEIRNLLRNVDAGADLVIGSRYVAGGTTPGWSWRRRFVSRSGSRFARVVLGLRYRDLTGGFKAWRRDFLAELGTDGSYANGYGFQIEMTWRARQLGASIVEVPITFRERIAGSSKMSGGIVGEAALMVLRLRFRPGLSIHARRTPSAP
jgi:Glycosyltransferases involved in cell wall biogenesis